MNPARIATFAIVILLSALPIKAGASSPREKIEQEIAHYFQKALNVPGSDIQLRFIYSTGEEQLNLAHKRLEVESNSSYPRLGYQTLSLNILANGYVEKRISVTVDVTVFMEVVVAREKIKRGAIITADKITRKRVKVGKDFRNVIRDSEAVVGLMAKHMIKPGSIIRKSMVKTKPTVKKGETVTIQMISGDLVISTKGKTKQDAMIGEKVKITCELTGKQLYGVVQSPQLVTVSLR